MNLVLQTEWSEAAKWGSILPLTTVIIRSVRTVQTNPDIIVPVVNECNEKLVCAIVRNLWENAILLGTNGLRVREVYI